MTQLTQSPLDEAITTLLTPGGLDAGALDPGLDHALGAGIDYADLYFQRSWHETWVLEDGEVKDASYNIDGGVGVRALAGEKTGFAYSNQITAEALAETGRTASGIARSGARLAGQPVRHGAAPLRYAGVDPLSGLTAEEKIALLKQADRIARSADPSISQVTASLTGVHEVVLVRASDGTLAADIRHADEGRAIARAEAVYVMMTTEPFEKTPVPDDLRTLLQTGAPGVVMDQSGR